MPAKLQGSQTDFSFGEVDPALKRADQHPARKAGLRQMRNARILNSGTVQDRPGRRAQYPASNGGIRTERITMTSGSVFDIQFAPGRVQIVDFSTGINLANFAVQGNGAALPWASTADIQSIVYAIFNLTITITFGHAMRPQVLTWDGVTTWSIADYKEAIFANGQKRTPFYRLSPQSVAMLPSATTGNITVKFSSPIVVAGMVGTRMRFCNRQILLGAVIDTYNINATVIEPLPPGVVLGLSASHGTVAIGDLVTGVVSGAQGIVTATPTSQAIQTGFFATGTMQIGDAVTGGTSAATGVVAGFLSSGYAGLAAGITVTLSTGTAFVSPETITGAHGSVTSTAVSPINLVVQSLQNAGGSLASFIAGTPGEGIEGPSGSFQISTVTLTTPQAVAIWDDEVMNSFRGFPGSCFADQFRVGFCDFPSLPGGICWSAINAATDILPGPNPGDAMFELTPAKTRVRYVVPGPESNEFVFCDTRLFYIPISPTNPLKPGSVQFLLLSGDGSAQVQPRVSQEAILYVNAGGNSMMAVIATGAYLRPFNTKNLSDFHGHLFNNIQCIAAPSADGTFNERYAYVLNGDGSIAVGKYDPGSLQTSVPVIGWGPWSGAGAVKWIGARAADVVFTSLYSGALIVEVLDDTQYLDAAILVNAPPSAFVAAGKGPLYLLAAGQSVTLIDQVTRVMGVYQVDANGNIIPQFSGGENLAIASLVAGQPFTMTIEPFPPAASTPGADVQHQRMMTRQIANMAVYVINATSYKFASLFSGKQIPTAPPLGTVVSTREVPAWNLGDDVTKPPPLRETVESWPPPGSSFDPRAAIIKDQPGPLQILEIGMEITL